jgi:hypothetical protein
MPYHPSHGTKTGRAPHSEVEQMALRKVGRKEGRVEKDANYHISVDIGVDIYVTINHV